MSACGILYITYRYGINTSMCVCACNVYIRVLQHIKFEPLMFYTSNACTYIHEFQLDYKSEPVWVYIYSGQLLQFLLDL